MRQILISLYWISLLLRSICITGQEAVNPEKISQIKIQVATPQGLEEQFNLASLLKKRITQAITLNGMATAPSHFLLTSSIQELSSRVTPSTPPQYTVELEIYCVLTDRTNQANIHQTAFFVKGIASSKEKARMNAIESIKTRNPQLKKFIVKGKEKIVKTLNTDTIYQFNSIQDENIR